MTRPQINSWQDIRAEVQRRIHAREWPPGQVIPGEVELAEEFGCARATVNRALRALAEAGTLERRRKAGTRVALHPVSRATVDIPVIRQEIEEAGQGYGYRLLDRFEANSGLTLRALHLADGAPYVHENRWISLETAPKAATQSFEHVSANEWLIATAPYTHGDIAFTAAAATQTEADALGIPVGAPLFIIERTTWDHDAKVTAVRLSYAPGHKLHTQIGA